MFDFTLFYILCTSFAKLFLFDKTLYNKIICLQVIIRGQANLNRAIDGDIIALEIFKKDKWVSPSEIILEDEAENVLDDNLEEKELVLSSLPCLKTNIKPTGRVVGIIKRKWRQYCGILQEGSGTLFHLFIPADKKIPKIRIETRQAETLKTQKIIVAIDNWNRSSRYPNVIFFKLCININQNLFIMLRGILSELSVKLATSKLKMK